MQTMSEIEDNLRADIEAAKLKARLAMRGNSCQPSAADWSEFDAALDIATHNLFFDAIRAEEAEGERLAARLQACAIPLTSDGVAGYLARARRGATPAEEPAR